MIYMTADQARENGFDESNPKVVILTDEAMAKHVASLGI